MNQGLIIVVLFVVACVAIYAYVSSQKRKKELSALATSWGFTWDDADPFEIEHSYEQFHAVSRGHGRRAYNVFHGERKGCAMICFDFRYQTGSGKSQSTHYLSGTLIRHGHPFPYLLIRPEGFFDKVKEFVGFDDIDFESAEFSRKFYVKSENRKFAFDLLHARAMTYMLAQPRHFAMEFRGDTMMVSDDSKWSSEEFEAAISQVEGLLELMPDYLRRALREGTI